MGVAVRAGRELPSQPPCKCSRPNCLGLTSLRLHAKVELDLDKHPLHRMVLPALILSDLLVPDETTGRHWSVLIHHIRSVEISPEPIRLH